MDIVKDLLKEYVSNSKKKNFWSGSPYEGLVQLGIDERGSWGENILFSLLSKITLLNSVWDGNSNTNREDGSIWDIKIENKKTEVKTAMRGTSTAVWQHEKIVNDNSWEKIVFIDVDYNGIWFTIQNYNDIPFGSEKHKLLNKKTTPCKGGWKFDLTDKHIEKLKNNNNSFYWDGKNPDSEGFKIFFEENF